MKCHKQQPGFTLIELLVVVAVISLLMAILLPALSAARRLAKRSLCGTQLRQISHAWIMYLDDHDGRFYQGTNANLNYGGWRGDPNLGSGVAGVSRPLKAYLNLPDDIIHRDDAKVFCCPADRGGIPGKDLTTRVYEIQGTSYNANIFLIGQDWCGSFSAKTAPLDEQISLRLPRMNIKRASQPSRLLLLGDYGWINQWRPQPLPIPSWKTVAEWHGKPDAYSMAFLDGHAAYLRIRKGHYVTDDYVVLPFKELYELAHQIQGSME